MKTITILIPAYNEEESINFLYERLGSVVKALTQYRFEILFVNDGSTDATLDIIKSLRKSDRLISYVNLSRNFGKETAMIAGLDHARGDALIIIDADLQDPPELILEMVKYWEMGYDDVYARRRSRLGESVVKKGTANLFYYLIQKTTSIPLQKNTGDFRLLDRRCMEALKQLRETHRYTKGLFSWIGYDKKEILFDRDPRIAGKTKWNYLKLVNLAVEGITSFTISPLRMSTILGGAISLLSFLYIIWVIIKTFLWGEPVRGYPSLLVTILFLGGIQLIFLGIIGEYVGKIFNESKNRPLYFVNEYNDKRISNHSIQKNEELIYRV